MINDIGIDRASDTESGDNKYDTSMYDPQSVTVWGGVIAKLPGMHKTNTDGIFCRRRFFANSLINMREILCYKQRKAHCSDRGVVWGV